MKKFAYLLGLVAVMFAAASCTKPPVENTDPQPFLTIERDTLFVSYLGSDGVEYLEIQSSSDWDVFCDEEWITTEPMGSLLGVEVEPNEGKESREATLQIISQELETQLVVVQFADTKVEATQIIPADTLQVVQPTMGTFAVGVVADGVYTIESSADWVSWDSQTVEGATILENFNVNGSYEKDPRFATITFRSENTSTSMRVMQWGSQNLYVMGDSLSFGFAKTEPQTFTLTANGEYVIDLGVWPDVPGAQWFDYEVKEGFMVDTVVVSVVDNDVAEQRSRSIVITCGDESAEIMVVQAAMKEFGDMTQMDLPTDTQIKVKSAAASSKYSSSYGPEKAIDGKDDTYWRADDWDKDLKQHWISFDFDPNSYEQIDYLIYTPMARYASDQGQWGETEIYVTDASGNETLYATHDFKMSRNAVRYDFEEPLKGVTKIRCNVVTAYQNNTSGRVYTYLSEMRFYQKVDVGNPLDVFTDWSLSELKEGVTLEQIEAMSNDSYRALAEQLYYGVYDKEFRVCKFKAFPHPDRDAAIFRTNTYTMLDNVTGMYVAEAGDTVRVCVSNLNGLGVKIRVIDWEKCEAASASQSNQIYLSSMGGYVIHDYVVSEGYNEIVPMTRGLMYIICHADDYENYPEMTAHFLNSEVNGYIELGKTDMSKAYELLRKGGNTEPHFDMLSHKAIINFPKTIFYESTFLKNPANTHRVEELLHLYDTVMYIQQEVQGHFKYKALGKQRVHRNRALFHGTYTSYYAASSSYRTYYNVTNIGKEVCNPSRMWNKTATSLDNGVVGSIWGLAHELGHTNQTEVFKWRGLTEVTNNLMCAITQYKFYGEGNTTMRFNDHFNKGMRDFVTRWNVHPDGTRRRMTHCESVNSPSVGNTEGGVDPTTQLMPFWQLYLYYHLVLGNEDFYPDFYELCRLSPTKCSNDEGHSQAIVDFVKWASDAAGEDLSEFCEAWGLPGVNDAVKVSHYGTNYITTTQAQADAAYEYCHKYAKPKLNPLYINDLNLDLYRNPKAVVAGTHTVDAEGNYSTEGWENVVAWGLKDPETGETLCIRMNDKSFKFGYQPSIYQNDGAGGYVWNANKDNRFLEPVTPQYRTDLQLFGIAADGTWVESNSNTH